MKNLGWILLLLLAGCSSAPSDPDKITITLENRTDEPVYAMLLTGSPFFPLMLTLQAHESKEFWAYRELMPGNVRLVVLQKRKGGEK